MLICNAPGCHEKTTGDSYDTAHGTRCHRHVHGWRELFRSTVRRIDPDGTVREVSVIVPVKGAHYWPDGSVMSEPGGE